MLLSAIIAAHHRTSTPPTSGATLLGVYSAQGVLGGGGGSCSVTVDVPSVLVGDQLIVVTGLGKASATSTITITDSVSTSYAALNRVDRSNGAYSIVSGTAAGAGTVTVTSTNNYSYTNFGAVVYHLRGGMLTRNAAHSSDTDDTSVWIAAESAATDVGAGGMAIITLLTALTTPITCDTSAGYTAYTDDAQVARANVGHAMFASGVTAAIFHANASGGNKPSTNCVDVFEP